MGKISDAVLKHKKTVIISFAAAVLICMAMVFGVKVNYNMADYLPEDAPSTAALEVMKGEFGGDVTNARVMLKNVTVSEALEYKDKLSKTEHVSAVMWLDDVIDIKMPVETVDADIVEQYYKDGCALISLTMEEGYETDAMDAVRKIIGEENALAGDAPSTATFRRLSSAEAIKAICYVLPIIIIILLLTTSSWLEPLLFLLTIGAAVIINMGTNLFFGEVSFITFSVSPILQMAVSLDYAIFLLHSFRKYREETDDAGAMSLAMKRSIPVVLASALTTILGFVVLVVMRFKIGPDLGINLAKGIALSLVCSVVFLPALTLASVKLLDKTRHKNIMPSFKKAGRFAVKLRYGALAAAVLLIVPCFLAQSQNSFSYGTGKMDPATRAGRDENAILEKFGESTPMVVLVPKGDVAREGALTAELEEIDNVSSVVSYAGAVGEEIPEEFISEQIADNFYSENYCRIIVYAATSAEGDEAFEVVKKVRVAAQKYYGQEALTCGTAANLYDMKDVVTSDNRIVNVLAICAIGLVILLTFKSLSLPLALLLTIELAIWINLSVPYFSGVSMNYLGYLVISTVQLGATVDYAILFADHYMSNRRIMLKREALRKTAGETMGSILTSGCILAAAGFVIYIVSTNPIVGELGLLLGRGTVLSMAMVLLLLPGLFSVFDGFIGVTTLRSGFLRKEKM